MLVRVVNQLLVSTTLISSPLHRCTTSKPLTRITRPFRPHATTTCFRSFRPHSQLKSDTVAQIKNISFCQWCGATTKQDIPDGDDKPRAICTSCGKVTYQNPKMVTGCLVEHDGKVLLCKRKIPPSYGLWTLPAGYMEMGESAVEGATRETWEEAGAEYTEDLKAGKPKFHHGTINKSAGTGPSDIHSFTLDDYFHC
ncbi:hypothetical protein IFM89_004493 [Coptis chinensis]|uniref:Nudix hydrolase domain-containing protein n=1 Tax=Coptis chinensis TaxID=261450 RepID=A0A835GVP2_9MAGN|nr:hypothetical protein IFM89_004493 [Coptis chinensis]